MSQEENRIRISNSDLETPEVVKRHKDMEDAQKIKAHVYELSKNPLANFSN